MSRIPTHTLADAPAGSREHLEQMKKRTGALLNMHAAMAHSPVVLAAYKAMSDAVAGLGTLDAATREAIARAVENKNGRHYCHSADTVSARAAGFKVDQTVFAETDLDVPAGPALAH